MATIALRNLDPAEFDYNLHVAGNIGVGTTTPSQKLDVGGNLILNAATSTLFLGSDSHQYIYGHAGSNYLTIATADTERLRIDSSGNVGIGTTSPAQLLHVEGASPVVLIKASDEAGTASLKFVSDQGDDNHDSRTIDLVDGGSMKFLSYEGGSWATHVTIDKDGKFGIGIAPTVKFHVYYNSASASDGAIIENAGGGVELKLTPSGTNTCGLVYGTAAGGDFYVSSTKTGVGETFRVTAAGLVGIGTPSPSAMLDVRAGAETVATSAALRTSIPDTVGNRGGLSILNANGGLLGGLAAEIITAGAANTSVGRLDLWVQNAASTTTAMTILKDGKVGIGTTGPTTLLHVAGVAQFGRQDSSAEGGEIRLTRANDDAAAWAIDVHGNSGSHANRLRFIDATSGAEKMTIDNNGYVGIGLSNPQYLLDVNGSVRAKEVRFTDGTVMTGASGGGGIQTTYFTSNGTFTVPKGVTSIRIKIMGGGGGARDAYNYRSVSVRGESGGAGGYCEKVIATTQNEQYTVVVGKGGGYGGTNPGANGTNSTFKGPGETTSKANITAGGGSAGGRGQQGGVATGGDLNVTGVDGINPGQPWTMNVRDPAPRVGSVFGMAFGAGGGFGQGTGRDGVCMVEYIG